MRRCLAFTLFFFLFPGPALAGDFGISISTKSGPGGILWSQPTNTSGLDSSNTALVSKAPPYFDNLTGGYSYSTGLFTDFRFFEFFGLETGVILTHHTLLWRTDHKVEGEAVAKSNETIDWAALRVPIMGKFVVPVRKSAVWVGVGVEFSFGNFAELSQEFTRSNDFPEGTDLRDLNAVTSDDTYVIWGAGFEVDGGPTYRIPVELRFGYNLSQSKNYGSNGQAGRMTIEPLPTAGAEPVDPTRITITAQDSWYVDLLIGVSYTLY
jgi:hypothetical protein